ncbi:MAG: MotA/TolQ/ExbB proton channel family protein [Phycisphaerae bacterium]|nr:MotA/TolQ/ExbB proton channel family protein [Phycisphaerae bacterium]
MQPFIDILYYITVALKGPVIIALILALGLTLYEVGGFFYEWRYRKSALKKWQLFIAMIPDKQNSAGLLKAKFLELGAWPTLVALFAKKVRNSQQEVAYLDKLISEIEIEANKSCYRMNMGVRVAPMLGLMGTLIPMGPALKGIATGNFETMAGNLIVAFSTTVVGLVIGAICYVMFIARQHWYAKDLSDIEYVYKNVFLPREVL